MILSVILLFFDIIVLFLKGYCLLYVCVHVHANAGCLFQQHLKRQKNV